MRTRCTQFPAVLYHAYFLFFQGGGVGTPEAGQGAFRRRHSTGGAAPPHPPKEEQGSAVWRGVVRRTRRYASLRNVCSLHTTASLRTTRRACTTASSCVYHRSVYNSPATKSFTRPSCGKRLVGCNTLWLHNRFLVHHTPKLCNRFGCTWLHNSRIASSARGGCCNSPYMRIQSEVVAGTRFGVASIQPYTRPCPPNPTPYLTRGSSACYTTRTWHGTSP